MSNIIKPKRGTTDPAQGVLAEGEIGINTSAATAFVGVAGGGSKKLNAGNSETTDAVNSTGEAIADRNRHIWFSDADDEKKRVYNDNFQYNPSTNTISSNVGGTSSNVTGVVDLAHGGTGRTNRDSGYSNLMSGGIYEGSLNDAQNAGVYIFTTTNTTEYPTYAGRTDNWARLEVTTSTRDSAEVMQRVIYSTDGVEFTRLHAKGTTWTSWQIVVGGAVAHRQFLQSIPSGADLNDDKYLISGAYASDSSDNIISNLPPCFGNGKGAFTLLVTGITSTTSYTNQILIALDNIHIYIRSQTSWEKPWIWTDWAPIPIDFVNKNVGKSEVHLNISQLNIEPNLYFDRSVGGYKYTRLYEANAQAAELAFAQKYVNGSEAISRLTWDGDHIEFRGDNDKMWLGSSAHPMARFYTSDHGTSLPAAGNKGRVFFKKV